MDLLGKMLPSNESPMTILNKWLLGDVAGCPLMYKIALELHGGVVSRIFYTQGSFNGRWKGAWGLIANNDRMYCRYTTELQIFV